MFDQAGWMEIRKGFLLTYDEHPKGDETSSPFFFCQTLLSFNMSSTRTHLWHYAPFLRLLIPLMAGITIQWYLHIPIGVLLVLIIVLLLLSSVYFFLSDADKYRFASVNGLILHVLIATTGGCLVFINDIRNEKSWVGHFNDADYHVIRLLEPLVEKENSYKALADIQYILSGSKTVPAEGKLIVYFKKDSSIQNLDYGSQLLFKKGLQEIKNSGNPGGFNYKQYCLQQGITHQVYLTEAEFQKLLSENKNEFKDFLFRTRKKVVGIIRQLIPGEREQGLAEALLIGYKDDLDKSLVQSYSNTGVVHIIAISGLHLGLIYWLLLGLTKPIKKKKGLGFVRFLIIILSLWIFSLLAGAGPSVLRSALMFSCIAFGEVLNKKSSIYNTLALSAFILLCINPFWLWDVGFQLSYSAVLSIIIFFRPIYNWFYIKNKIGDWLWKLNALTLAAQVLTLPISIFHFHQFPVLFLLANLVAVPLSSLIVIGEIILIVSFIIRPLAEAVGWVLQKLIAAMNFYVERLDSVSFAVWNNLSISFVQAVFLLGFIACIGYWLMEKQPKTVCTALICLLGFVLLRSASFVQASQQKKIIVYNVPKHQAIDVIDGRNYFFIGDRELESDDFIRNFHLQPSRVLHRISAADGKTDDLKAFEVYDRKVIIIENEISFNPITQKLKADIVVLSKNPKLYVNNLHKAFDIGQLVIDGSVPAWKAKLWQKDCDSLGIACHNVSEKGAFVMKVQ